MNSQLDMKYQLMANNLDTNKDISSTCNVVSANMTLHQRRGYRQFCTLKRTSVQFLCADVIALTTLSTAVLDYWYFIHTVVDY